jgi:hypothetical protein
MKLKNIEMQKFDISKPRKTKMELITYKCVEYGLSVTDMALVSECSVDMVTNDRNHKEIIFSPNGDTAGVR